MVSLGHGAIGHGLDHFRAVFDHALLFRLGADHKAGGVVEEQNRRVALLAQLDKLRALAAPLRVIGPLLPIKPAGLAFDLQVAADGLVVELVFEVEERRAVGDARDDFAHVVGFFRICGNQAEQFLNRVQRLAVALNWARGWLRSGSMATISRAVRTASASFSARYSAVPATWACISAPPNCSSVAISPVAAFSRGGPARNILALPRTTTT